MPSVQNVSLTPVNDYSVDLAANERKRKLADALTAQSQQALPTDRMAGGYVIPISPTEGLAKMAQALAGGYVQGKADARDKEISQQYQSDLSQRLAEGLKAIQGTAAQPGGAPTDYQGQEMAGPPSPATPAQAPDLTAAATMFMSHPALQGIGSQLLGQALADQRRKAIMSQLGIGSPQASPTQALNAEQASGGQPGPTNDAAGRIGAPNGGIPGISSLVSALTLSGDPALGKLGEMAQKADSDRGKIIAGRPGAPMWGQDANGNPVIVGFNPKTETGQTMSPQGVISTAPGFLQSQAQLGQTPMQQVTNPNQTTSFVPKSQLIAQAQGNPGMPQMPAFQPQQPQMPQQGPQTTIAPSVSPTDINGITNPQDRAAAMQALQHGNFSGPPTPQLPQAPAIPNQPAQQGGIPQFGQTQEQQIQQAAQLKQSQDEAASRAALTYEAPQARSAVSESVNDLQRMEALARQIRNNPDISRISGSMGMFPNMPGSNASDLAAKLNSLKSQVGFGRLQAMRNASKTGGALGAISDKENDLLQRNLAALDTSQSPQALAESLDNIIKYSQGAQGRLQNAYRDLYERNIGNQGMQPTPGGALPLGQSAPLPSGGKLIKWSDLK